MRSQIRELAGYHPGAFVAACLTMVAALLMIASMVTADPPGPDGGEGPAMGACCFGPEVAPVLRCEQAECVVWEGIWVRGDFEDWTDRDPCDLLPGGD